MKHYNKPKPMTEAKFQAKLLLLGCPPRKIDFPELHIWQAWGSTFLITRKWKTRYFNYWFDKASNNYILHQNLSLRKFPYNLPTIQKCPTYEVLLDRIVKLLDRIKVEADE